jgi:hypothetical protein
MSKFADFVKEKKMDPRRIIAASFKLEKLGAQDRALRLAQRKAKKSEEKKDPNAPKADKPRSGRPITQPAWAAALAGKPLSGPQKTRMLRAINHVLEQKKGAAVEMKALF